MANTKDVLPPLEICNVFHEQFHQILLANPFEAFKMLGAFVAPDGNTEEQVKRLKAQAQAWATKVEKSYLTPHETLTAFTQVLFPALVYPVAVIALTEDECDDITRPALQALLKILHLPINTSRLILYGPARYGGFGIPNLYVQGY